MAKNKNAKIQMESGRTLVDYVALVDSGDNQTFNAADAVWSGRDGFAPDIRPNGVTTGIDLGSPAASGTNNLVDVKAFSAYSKGVEYAVSAATDTTIARAATNVASVSSVTMTDAGAIAVVKGVDSADTTISETRGAAGGPPLIPVNSVELFQVRTISNVAAAITTSEIFQNIGQHLEKAGFPVVGWNNTGLGTYADETAEVNAFVKMNSALPLIHTGAVPKAIWVKYYTPTFADLSKTLDYVPAEKSHSVSTTEYYGGSINDTSESLGQASFTALLTDGISDAEVSSKNQVVTVKFFQDRNKTAYILQQGTLGVSRSFAVANQVQASMTLSTESESAEFAS